MPVGERMFRLVWPGPILEARVAELERWRDGAKP